MSLFFDKLLYSIKIVVSDEPSTLQVLPKSFTLPVIVTLSALSKTNIAKFLSLVLIL